jgi:hypothetical protein
MYGPTPWWQYKCTHLRLAEDPAPTLRLNCCRAVRAMLPSGTPAAMLRRDRGARQSVVLATEEPLWMHFRQAFQAVQFQAGALTRR